MSAHQLVGTWRLLSWENRAEDGSVSYPFGRNPVGYIMYGADGFMSVSIMNPERSAITGGDLWSGSDEEVGAAYRSHLSYCGRYEVQEDRVLHHVEVASFPNWVGATQVRPFELDDDRLKLSTPPILQEGFQQTAHLFWDRV